MINLSRFIYERLVNFRNMMPLSIAFFFYLFGWGLTAPILNIRVNEITGSLLLSGIVFSMFGFVRVFVDPAIGMLSDRINPKRLIQYSLGTFIMVFFLYAIVDTFLELLMLRVFHGLAAAMLWIGGWTLVRRQSMGKYAQEKISIWSSIQHIAYLVGPLIGGFIITFFDWKPTFYLGSLFSLVALLYSHFKIKSPNVETSGGVKTFREQLRRFFSNGMSTRLIALTLVLFSVISAFSSFLTIHLDSNGISIEEISIIISFGVIVPYIIFPIVVGVISDRYGRKMPTLVGLLFISVGVYAFSGAVTFAQFLFYTFIIFTGDSFVSSSLNAELNDFLPDNQAGGYTGLFEMVKDVGYTVGPLIAGAVGFGLSLQSTFLVLSVITVCSTVILKGFNNY